ncbi:hypothetical protein VPMS16_323 [Vibrio sp. 16]|nr:hypothetical protein VPMS16_323 [Vibrio sp. 16]
MDNIQIAPKQNRSPSQNQNDLVTKITQNEVSNTQFVTNTAKGAVNKKHV